MKAWFYNYANIKTWIFCYFFSFYRVTLCVVQKWRKMLICSRRYLYILRYPYHRYKFCSKMHIKVFEIIFEISRSKFQSVILQDISIQMIPFSFPFVECEGYLGIRKRPSKISFSSIIMFFVKKIMTLCNLRWFCVIKLWKCNRSRNY